MARRYHCRNCKQPVRPKTSNAGCAVGLLMLLALFLCFTIPPLGVLMLIVLVVITFAGGILSALRAPACPICNDDLVERAD